MREIDYRLLYQLVKPQAEQVELELHLLAEIMLRELSVRWYLKDHAVDKTDRLKLIRELLPPVSGQFVELVGLLIDVDLINRLPTVAHKLSEVVSQETGRQFLEVRSAGELPEALKTRLLRQYGEKFRVRFVLDPQIIGGLKLNWEDGHYIDSTVAGELEALKEALLV